MDRVAYWTELASANGPGIVALAAGTMVGLYTAGPDPGPATATRYIGFPALQAWVTGAVVYLIGVTLVLTAHA